MFRKVRYPFVLMTLFLGLGTFEPDASGMIVNGRRLAITGQDTLPRQRESVTLEGSRWTLAYDHPRFGSNEYTLVFHANGKLENHHPNESTPDNDRWEQRGDTIVLRFNDGFAVYEGEILDERTMSGVATSRTGGTWEWKAFRGLSVPSVEAQAEEEVGVQGQIVTLFDPTAPASVTRAGETVRIRFRRDRSLEGEKYVLVLHIPVGQGGVASIDRFLYEGRDFSMASGTQGELQFLLSTPEIKGPPDPYGMQSSFFLRGKRQVGVELFKCLNASCNQKSSMSNRVTFEIEFGG